MPGPSGGHHNHHATNKPKEKTQRWEVDAIHEEEEENNQLQQLLGGKESCPD